MNNSLITYYLTIDRLIASYSKRISSASIVGSSAVLSNEVVDLGSDIDIVILWNSVEDLVDSKLDLINKLHNSDLNIKIVDIWGIASPAVFKRPIIHLHDAPAEMFSTYSSLYRRSVSKYPPIFGKPLQDYAPQFPITREELLSDPLGPKELLTRLVNKDFYDIIWDTKLPGHREKIWPIASEPVDFLLYTVLHSIRNILRYLDTYIEFKPINQLSDYWTQVGAPNVDILNYFIELKKERRKMKDFLFIENDIKSAQILIQEALDWLV